MYRVIWLGLVIALAAQPALLAETPSGDTTAASAKSKTMSLDSLNVVWDSPSEDHHGSMPLGNGVIGLNAWIDEVGNVHFYIGRIDSFSEGGSLLKVGKVRVSFTPNLIDGPAAFRQELNLKNGELTATIDGGNRTLIKLWVDASHPVIHVECESQQPVSAAGQLEIWREAPMAIDTFPGDVTWPNVRDIQPDVVIEGLKDRIGWYHHNDESFGPKETMEFQDLAGYPAFIDPQKDLTFGGIVTADNGVRVDGKTLAIAPATRQVINVYCLAVRPSTPESWLVDMDQAIATTQTASHAERYAEHVAWWRAFWERSWIYIAENEDYEQAKGAGPTANELPLRIGFDQHGGSVLDAQFGRVAVYQKTFTEQEVAKLRETPPDAPAPEWAGAVHSAFPPPKTEFPDSAGWDNTPALALEAWVNVASPRAVGRIFDKITPGGSDGFLVDLYPAGKLRMIVGGATQAGSEIPPGIWTHLVAVIDGAGPRLYRDGNLVLGAPGETRSDAETVTRAYALQRFINACAGRGRYPIKFNGSLFTVPHEGVRGDADYRRWGPGYWWQNTRLPYMSMCTSGDFDLMQPFISMYLDEVLPLCEYRTKHYFGFDGAYFPECIYPWGAVFPQSYGLEKSAREREDKLQTSGWHKWEWTSSYELVFMLLDYCAHTEDRALLREKVLPAAKSAARFFDNYYDTDEEGKLFMHPAQALETWWDCDNVMPDVAGLRAVAQRILALPNGLLTDEQRAFWTAFYAKLPELPLRDTPSGPALAPAARYENKSNIENPELYAVFPFRQIAFEKPNLDWGLNALEHRWDRGASGWRQDDLFMAYMGLAEQARANVIARARTYDSGSRFPAFWGPNYDWIPDQDHGGVLMKAIQALLMQTDGDAIYLLPAWPKGWDARFKLHAPKQTTVEAEVEDGRIVSLKVTPKSREKDLVIVPSVTTD